jgi:serine/threonine protein kinase
LKNYRIKLSDLGEAKNLENSIVRTYAGSAIYISPEMIMFEKNKNINISFKTDVWSLGVIIFELFTLKRPFNDKNGILKNQTPDLELYIPDLYRHIVKE